MSEDKSKIIELSSGKRGQKEATPAMGSGQVILQSIECSEDELYRRLAMVYKILLDRTDGDTMGVGITDVRTTDNPLTTALVSSEGANT